MHELHNTLVPEIVWKLLVSIRQVGGDWSDVALLLTSIVAGTLSQLAISGRR